MCPIREIVALKEKTNGGHLEFQDGENEKYSSPSTIEQPIAMNIGNYTKISILRGQ